MGVREGMWKGWEQGLAGEGCCRTPSTSSWSSVPFSRNRGVGGCAPEMTATPPWLGTRSLQGAGWAPGTCVWVLLAGSLVPDQAQVFEHCTKLRRTPQAHGRHLSITLSRALPCASHPTGWRGPLSRDPQSHRAAAGWEPREGGACDLSTPQLPPAETQHAVCRVPTELSQDGIVDVAAAILYQ